MGLLSDPVLKFRDDLADSLAVREVLGIVPSGDLNVDIAEAKLRIHIDGLPAPIKGQDALTAEELTDLRPYILLYPDEAESLRIRITASPRCIETGGTIMAMVSLPYEESEADDGPTSIWESTAAKIDRLLWNDDPDEPGIVDYVSRDGRTQILDLDVVMFGRTPLSERLDYGDAYDVMIVCRWGVA
jgi:hypothetical protein